MELRTVGYNLYAYIYLIFVVGSITIYAFNFGDFKEEYNFCASYYDDPLSEYKELMYWQEDGLCCHYTLNEESNIIQQCQT